MKKIALLVATLTFTLGMSAIVMADCPDNIDFNQMHIKWSDEFNGNSLNTKYWEYQTGDGSQYGIPGWGNNEKQWYRSQNVSVANGSLAITAKSESIAGKKYTSGRIRTWDGDGNKPKVSIGLGYVEARLKIPSNRGIWPAFWMLGNNGKTWPACGEIDIEESFNYKAFAQGTIHFAGTTGKDVYYYDQANPTGYDKTEWNTYGVYRDGNWIAFYLNGEKYSTEWRTTNVGDGDREVLNDDYHILLNFAVGGNLAGGEPGSGDLPLTMYCDYVRYYQEGPAPTTVAPTKKTTTVSPLAKAKIKSLKNVKKRKLKVTLKKIKGAQGYQIRWCDSKSFDGYEQKNVKKPKITLKGLDKKTTYWVKARAYKKVNGAKTYGKWSKAVKKKVKK